MFAWLLVLLSSAASAPTEAMGTPPSPSQMKAWGEDPAFAAAEAAWDDLWVGRKRDAGWLDGNVRAESLVVFGQGRRALLAGELLAAQQLLARVDAGSPLYAPARILLGDAHQTLGKLKSAVRAYRDAVRSESSGDAYQGLAVMRIASVYASIDRTEEQERFISLVGSGDAALPAAMALRLPSLALSTDLVQHRRAIGWAEHLQALPPKAGWFDPSVPLWSAAARLSLCGYEQARDELDEAAARRAELSGWFASMDSSSADRLWSVARDGAWPDARLGGWIEADFRLRPLIALGRHLEERGDRPADLAVVRSEAVGWLRVRLAEAATLLRVAEDNARLVEEDLARGLASPPRATVCYIRPPGLLGHLAPRRNRDPSLVQLHDRKSTPGPWHDALKDVWYDGETQCTVPTEPVHCAYLR